MTDSVLSAFPILIGSVSHQTALRLAEHAIDIAAARSKSSKKRFGVAMDIAGRILLDYPEPSRWPAGQYLRTIHKQFDPDELADEIKHEADSRDLSFKRNMRTGVR